MTDDHGQHRELWGAPKGGWPSFGPDGKKLAAPSPPVEDPLDGAYVRLRREATAGCCGRHPCQHHCGYLDGLEKGLDEGWDLSQQAPGRANR